MFSFTDRTSSITGAAGNLALLCAPLLQAESSLRGRSRSRPAELNSRSWSILPAFLWAGLTSWMPLPVQRTIQVYKKSLGHIDSGQQVGAIAA